MLKIRSLQMPRKFYGWWVTAAAFVTFGLSVGIPYYNIGFFYDYFQREFHWSRADITLGFPLAALLTLWVGPLVIHRFSPRKLILAGTALTAVALIGFGRMSSVLWVYYAFWVLYTVGYIFSGPIPHQLIVSHWFRRNRGKAMGIVYVGVGLLGSLGSFLVKPLTESLGFHAALMILAGMVLLVSWPVVLLFLKDRPSDIGQFPDGDSVAPAEASVQSASFSELLGSWPFWLLLIGSFCSIGSIGAINFHMKFVFLDEGYTKGPHVDAAWRNASVLILWSSIGGRLLIGGLADRFSKKAVMTATYFLVAATIPLLLAVRPSNESFLYAFAVLFGFGMGADYMLIPLMAAEEFGVNSLARAMAIILPVNTIGQTWFPYFVSILRETLGNYVYAMGTVLAVALIGAVSILMLPRKSKLDETLRGRPPAKASVQR
jgi:MFS family permease